MKSNKKIFHSTETLLAAMKQMATPDKIRSMKRVHINTEHAIGVSIPALRGLAKKTTQSKALAKDLWATKIHEARILAGMLCPVEDVDEALAEDWVTPLIHGICVTR